jgi:hypothetical protein
MTLVACVRARRHAMGPIPVLDGLRSVSLIGD